MAKDRHRAAVINLLQQPPFDYRKSRDCIHDRGNPGSGPAQALRAQTNRQTGRCERGRQNSLGIFAYERLKRRCVQARPPPVALDRQHVHPGLTEALERFDLGNVGDVHEGHDRSGTDDDAEQGQKRTPALTTQIGQGFKRQI
ncbi:hypothetical protein D3C85_559730 [compost metagenome]